MLRAVISTPPAPGTLRLDCHTHTRPLSSCSALPPQELCALAQEQGLHGLVLTEHREYWRPERLQALAQDFPGLRLYGGVELSLAEGYDVVCITGSLALDLPTFPTLAEVRAVVDPLRPEVFSYVAHPFRVNDRMTPQLRQILQWVDGIEMNSVNIIKGAWQIHEGRYLPITERLYAQACTEHNLVPLYNTDSHKPLAVGCLANEFTLPALPEDAAGLGRLLRQRSHRQWQNPERIAAFLTTYRPR